MAGSQLTLLINCKWTLYTLRSCSGSCINMWERACRWKTWNSLIRERNTCHSLGINYTTHFLCHFYLFLVTNLWYQIKSGAFYFLLSFFFSSLTNGQTLKGEESWQACSNAAPCHSKSSAVESFRKKFRQKLWILLPSFQGCYPYTSFLSWTPGAFAVVHR